MDDKFVNIRLDEDDIRILMQMMREDFIDNRSVFIRRLIRQEWARRHSRSSPAVSIAAGKEINNDET